MAPGAVREGGTEKLESDACSHKDDLYGFGLGSGQYLVVIETLSHPGDPAGRAVVSRHLDMAHVPSFYNAFCGFSRDLSEPAGCQSLESGFAASLGRYWDSWLCKKSSHNNLNAALAIR